MGSSPVTATIVRTSVLLLDTLERFFLAEHRVAPGDGVVAAFSGGPDSTALLWGLSTLARRADLRVVAAHLDHAADPGSTARADAACAIAAALGIPWVVERRDVPRLRRPGESHEAAGRRVRYEVLEEVRRRESCRWVATAHHRDDQAETVVLRLRQGSGLTGLAGIQRQRGRIVRPLLDLPRRHLGEALAESGLHPVDDPTNRDPDPARNFIRHRLLPSLDGGEGEIAGRLARVASAAGRARDRLATLLASRLHPTPVAGGLAVDRSAFEALPTELRAFALAELHRRAGAPYPAASAARDELQRQLSGGRVGCDCGRGFRWESRDRLLVLRQPDRTAETPRFAYTLRIPGEVEIPELGQRLRLRRESVAPWMFRGAEHRAGLALAVAPGEEVVVRNRRPGDRLRPLGAAGPRRLKEVLIDRRVPREVRDRLPLLVVGGRIAWVPGVTIDEAFRLAADGEAWVAEVRAR